MATTELETVDKKKEHGSYDGNLPAPSPVRLGTLFIHPDSHPIILDLAALKKYGAEWLEWEPETLQLSLQQDYGSVSDLNMSKLMGMKTLHVVDSPWLKWEVFLWCAMPLNGVFPDFQTMQVPTVAQCAVAVEIADHVRRDVAWGPEIKKYLEVVHEHDGIYLPQTPLEVLVNHADLDLPEGLDIDELKARWPDVRRSLQAPTGENIEDEQLRRMLSVYEHLEESRSRMRSQLPLVEQA